MRRSLLLLAALSAAWALPAEAGVVFPDAPADAVALPDLSPLTLVSQQVDVVVVDQVATTTAVHVFRNDTDRPVAGTFVLPLAEAASVQEYAFWVGGHRVASSLKEKAAAKAEFEAAQARGENAALLEYKDADSFTARFTELGPGETRRFEVVYSELLPYAAGIVRYSHPLDYAELGMRAPEELQVRVRLDDSKPIVSVTTPGFPATVRGDTGTREAVLRLADTLPGQDFVLEYQLESRDFGLSFRTYSSGDDEGFFVATVAPREEASDEQIVRKDIAFVIDTSGSMSGPKIDQARQALKACLDLMNPGDGVYVAAFSDVLNPWTTRPYEVGDAQWSKAKAFADGLRAGGGTAIQMSLLSTLKVLERSERPTAIVFLTDGMGNRPVEETLKAVEGANAADRTRIFSFGIGSGVNQSFLERLGRENRGGYTHIDGGVPIDQAVAEFYSTISRPVLTDLAFDFGEVVPNRTYPAVLPDIYQGQRLVVSGRYRGDGPTTLTVSGTIGGEPKELSLPITFPVEDAEHPWVARLWAKRRADHLLADIRMYGETPEARDEVVALSTEYRFATPYTSLVAKVDPRVASLTPARIKPGDPVLAIPAPKDAVAVTAFLPFGEVKDLVVDARTGLWTTRFLVPRSVDDGVYWIHVVATRPDGTAEWFKLSYTVDTTAPVLRVLVDRPGQAYGPGETLAMNARPVIGFLELGSEMVRALGRDAAARAKAFVDVKQVVARIAGTDLETTLRSTPGAEPGWSGIIELPLDLPSGEHRLEVTATDVAGNKHTVVTVIRVESDAVVGVF